MKKLLVFTALLLTLTGCFSENYSNGERIGLITQFSQTGIVWKSWEGHLNVTQTGMNSSVPFDFSVDNDNQKVDLIQRLDSAANLGWKVKVVYHETFNKNWWHNRGETNHFVNDVVVLDKSFSASSNTARQQNTGTVTGRVVDTIYVVIDHSK